MSFQKILVPTDGSNNTMAAINKAMELAKAVNGSVTALFVVDQSMLVNMPMDAAVRNVYGALTEEGQKAVDDVLNIGKEAGVEVTPMVKDGTPFQVIIDESANFDVVVMGTLGRTGMSKLVMGSVADRVIRGAKCPVMVVRSTEAKS
ncbi:MAG: universal stress protein [Candidatus Methanomethylophilaceae archaeon]|nr:universal stress protein [Candidatus Methanomethylophilaceae archaeon]